MLRLDLSDDEPAAFVALLTRIIIDGGRYLCLRASAR